MHRHNRIFGELARDGEIVLLLTKDYSQKAEVMVPPEPQLPGLTPMSSALPWRTFVMHETFFWHVFVTKLRWSPRVFDPLVRLLADNVLANSMIIALDCKGWCIPTTEVWT